MNFTSVKSITIPEGKAKKITCGGVVLWKSGPTNLVPLSTEADGKTIYNGGKGYKDGYRIRSGGAEATQASTCCTGYITFVKGDKLYIYPPFTGKNTQNAINFYDGSFACLGQITDGGTAYGFCTSDFKATVVNGASVLDISNITVSGIENVAYVRISNGLTYDSPINMRSGSEMIITKNEEIEL